MRAAEGQQLKITDKSVQKAPFFAAPASSGLTFFSLLGFGGDTILFLGLLAFPFPSNPRVFLELMRRQICWRAMRWRSVVVVALYCWICLVTAVRGIGANWGTQTSHPLSADVVVQLLRDNGFQKVKLFDADPDAMNALKKSGLEVMLGIPNDMLASLASNAKNADEWVSQNVSSYVKDGVNIRLRFDT